MLSVQYAKDLAIQAWEWQASRFRGVKQQDKFKTFRTFLVFFFTWSIRHMHQWQEIMKYKKETNKGTCLNC